MDKKFRLEHKDDNRNLLVYKQKYFKILQDAYNRQKTIWSYFQKDKKNYWGKSLKIFSSKNPVYNVLYDSDIDLNNKL